MQELIGLFFSSFCFTLQIICGVLRNFFDFILDFITAFNNFLFAITDNEEVGLAKLIKSKFKEGWVGNAVENICILHVLLSVVAYLLQQGFAYFFFGHFSLKWFFICPHRFFD